MTNSDTQHTTHLPTDTHPSRHAVLVPGYWLGAWAWEGVEPALRAAGITPHAVTLPGLDGSPTDGLTLDDHADAVARLVDSLDGEVALVGHSGGAAVVQTVVDRTPDRIARAIYVDAGPMLDGVALRPEATADLPLPTPDEMAEQHLSTDGLDDATLASLRQRAVAHPAGVATSPVRVTNPARLAVPTTVICTSLPSVVLTGMIEAGHLPSELPEMSDVHFVDLPTGHWPMFSRPDDLAAVIRDELLGS